MLSGVRVEISEEEYNELQRLMREDYDNYPKDLGSLLSQSMGEGVNYRPDYVGCCDVAEEEITDVKIENQANFTWKYTELSDDELENMTEEEQEELYSEANRPQCDLIFTVKDKDILFHLQPGCVWKSAMFNLEYYA